MDSSKLPERLRRRAEEIEKQPSLDKVREFLGAYLFDAVSLEEAREDLQRTAAWGTWNLKLELRAFDAVLDEPQAPGVLMRMVASDANWVLDDLSDGAAAAFLRQVANILREVIAEADRSR
ncbi:hypothetical protein WEI85_09950 [Actinomycetes bacterium KLBMP 9797]